MHVKGLGVMVKKGSTPVCAAVRLGRKVGLSLFDKDGNVEAIQHLTVGEARKIGGALIALADAKAKAGKLSMMAEWNQK